MLVSVDKVKSGIVLDRRCEKCGGNVFVEVWGKLVCKNCYLERERKKGHSGMVVDFNFLEKFKSQTIFYTNEIELVRVPKGHKAFSTLFITHYPNSKGIVGRSINYLIYYKGRFAGIIGACSPPYKVKPVDEFFGITDDNREEMMRKILNNEVFRLIIHEKNLASRVLSVFRKQVFEDYYEKYREELIGLITFVEPPLKGACYKADNWVFIGYTKGYGTTMRDGVGKPRKWVNKKRKLIFAYKYRM
jgi:hypothetical protein